MPETNEAVVREASRTAKLILLTVPKVAPATAEVVVRELIVDAIERAMDPDVAALRALEDEERAAQARKGYKLPEPTE